MPYQNFLLKQLTATQAKRQQLKTLLQSSATSSAPTITIAHNPESAIFVKGNNQVVATGYTALALYMRSNPTVKVFLKEAQKMHDIAMEGGGAYGFAHLGTLHAMALKGIWFDRVAGTSAGALAAAMVAGGYRVDLNYKTNTDLPATVALTPSKDNSLNQIMFDDFFSPFTDYEQRIPQVTTALKSNDSVVYQFLTAFVRGVMKDNFSIESLKNKISVAAKSVQDTYFLVENTIISGVMDATINPPWPLPAVKLGDVGIGDVKVKNLVGNMRASFEDIVSRAIAEPVRRLTQEINKGIGPITAAIDRAMSDIVVGITDAMADTLLVNLVTKRPSVAFRNGSVDFRMNDSINQSALAIFRLLEYGGFWEGDYIRDWIEKHLQQLNFGSGVLLDGQNRKPSIKDMTGATARAILFKDLKIDLCIIAADMGPANTSVAIRPVPVFFSKRTTPDYPVAEAVRRSMSLPFVFISRRINDGYGENPENIGNVYENSKHKDHLLQDGGLFINLPVSVFRDLDDYVFAKNTKTDLKPVVISNINAGKTSSPCPDDVAASKSPEPIQTIQNTIEKTSTFAGSLLQAAPGSTPVSERRTPGIVKLKRSFDFISNYAINIHQEQEINSLIRLLPNIFFVDIPLCDPLIENGSSQEFTAKGRMDSGDFAMEKTTKKWLVQNAFEAAKTALKEYEEDYPGLVGKMTLPDSINPYNHFLQVSNAAVSTGSEVRIEPRAKFGDKAYVNSDSYIVKVDGLSPTQIGRQIPLGYEQIIPVRNAPDLHVMKGMGCTWIKIINNGANRQNAAANFLTFTINIRSRVFIALDVRPSFATTANGWRDENFRVILSLGPTTSVGNTPAREMFVFSKVFDAGNVVIPGPRNGTTIDNIYAYSVLARPV